MYREASSPATRPSSLTSAGIGTPSLRTPSAILSIRRFPTRAAFVIASATCCGTGPSPASARASAASTSSINWRRIASENNARISAVPHNSPKMSESAGWTLIGFDHESSNASSHVQKDGLIVALQHDIEVQDALGRAGASGARD